MSFFFFLCIWGLLVQSRSDIFFGIFFLSHSGQYHDICSIFQLNPSAFYSIIAFSGIVDFSMSFAGVAELGQRRRA